MLTPQTPPKILLVEDDEFIRDLYKKELERAGLPTDACANGKEGLTAITQNVYDLILLDIMLPDMNGLDILKQVKLNQNNKNTKVVLLTNLGQDAVIKEAFALGAIGYLLKLSYTPDQVIVEVKNFLSGKTPENH